MNATIKVCSTFLFFKPDIDECQMDMNACKTFETCVNTEGSFRCQCKEENESKEKESRCVNGTKVDAAAKGHSKGEDGGEDGLTTLEPGSKSGNAEHSISFGRPVVSESESNTSEFYKAFVAKSILNLK